MPTCLLIKTGTFKQISPGWPVSRRFPKNRTISPKPPPLTEDCSSRKKAAQGPPSRSVGFGKVDGKAAMYHQGGVFFQICSKKIIIWFLILTEFLFCQEFYHNGNEEISWYIYFNWADQCIRVVSTMVAYFSWGAWIRLRLWMWFTVMKLCRGETLLLSIGLAFQKRWMHRLFRSFKPLFCQQKNTTPPWKATFFALENQ